MILRRGDIVRLKDVAGVMRMKKAKASLGVLGITLLAAWALLTWGGSALPQARVQVCRVEMGSVEQVLALGGTLRYEMEFGAVSPVTGVVEQVYVTQGEEVTAGQPLFRLGGEVQAMAVSAALRRRSSLPEAVGANLGSAQLMEASAQLEALTVRAAADGTVQQVNVCEHGGVMAGSVAMAITGGSQEIQCSAVLRDAEKLRPGMAARILKDDEVLTMARVTGIGPAEVSSLTGQTVCQVSLAAEENIRLPLGAALEAEIILCGQEQVPVVPVQAVAEDGTVWWVSEGRGYETTAEVYMADEVCCWVNLPEGTMVICGGEEIAEGQRVKELNP